MANNSILTGATGEFYVAAYLSALGMVVGLPRAGVPGIDLFVAMPKGGETIAIQVKTGTTTLNKVKDKYIWRIKKPIFPKNSSLWYAFVYLPAEWPKDENKPPEVFFVPSKYVESVLANTVNFWMKKTEAEKHKGYEGAKILRRELEP
ncbi:MAG: hypothetical protein IT426_05400 [Pirellulales bacterium]|nr:hypothetical protein [Pirellulales bacterium]